MSDLLEFPPHLQEEEAAGWTLSCEFTPQEGPGAMARICKLPKPGEPVFLKRRPWDLRLFSWPWKPWHNVRVWIATGSVQWAEKDQTVQRTTITASGEGIIQMSTARA